MHKIMCKLESVIEGKVGHFILDHDTPLHIVKEMLFQFQKYLGQIEDAAKAQQELEKSDNQKSEEVNPNG